MLHAYGYEYNVGIAYRGTTLKPKHSKKSCKNLPTPLTISITTTFGIRKSQMAKLDIYCVTTPIKQLEDKLLWIRN